MTVKELVQTLNSYPDDYEVVLNNCMRIPCRIHSLYLDVVPSDVKKTDPELKDVSMCVRIW